MIPSAAEYFGFPSSWGPSPNTAVASEPATPLATVESQSTGALHQHPAIAIFGACLITAGLVAHSTRPLGRAGASGSLGPAKASVEGEI